ncbi:MAG TPA: phospholipase D-like domain-containing protein [Gammaproteobacteria bacterium]|nr:phospholipase D-like domain-containing protein [Gammaproteobacteria bacterium]
MAGEFQVSGKNTAAPFTLKLHRGDGMTLLAMNWKKDKPPTDFVGFAIEYKEPKGDRFYALPNRLSFPKAGDQVNPNILSTRLSPIQKFRWVHFPRNADLDGPFLYRVTPVFMNAQDVLSYGISQEVAIELRRETYPGKLNVTFTRGFVSSQAFVDRFESKGKISTLLPAKAADGLGFVPTHPLTKEALEWMGFEARAAILEVLDKAIADKSAKVRVVAYDLNEPDIVSRLEKLGARLRVIVDDSDDHGEAGSAETAAAARLVASAGAANVKRQKMGKLQHNKTIVVEGPKGRIVVCGSTNFSWRGLFVQANNALVLHGAKAIKPFADAFENYWNLDARGFGASASTQLIPLGLSDLNVSVAFSPHGAPTALLAKIAEDIKTKATSSVFYSLAFLFQTEGPIKEAIKKVTDDPAIFVYGISDKKVGGLDVQKPDGNVEPVFASELGKGVPEPFKSEPSGGFGTRMHHKFVVIDFDKPSARVYMGSYNFSDPADTKNGENLLLIKNRRIAVSYMIEALRIFDHYHFRVAEKEAKADKKPFALRKPPRNPGEKPWWSESYTSPSKIRDRQIFA